MAGYLCIIIIFRHFQTSDLLSLDLSSNNLSGVQTQLLLTVVNKLDTIDLSFTGLSREQVDRLLDIRGEIRDKVRMRGLVDYF